MNKILVRMATLSAPFADVLKVYDSLSREDQLLVSPSGKFVDSPNLVSRIIKYNNVNEPVGFAEAYKFNGTSTNSVYVVIAVNEHYRSLGIGQQLLRDLCNDCFNKNYNTIIYKCNVDNLASYKLAESMGIQVTGQTKNQVTFKLYKPTYHTNVVRNIPQYEDRRLYVPYYPYRGYYPYGYGYGLYPSHPLIQDNRIDNDNSNNNGNDNDLSYTDIDNTDFTDSFNGDMSGGDFSAGDGGGDGGGD